MMQVSDVCVHCLRYLVFMTHFKLYKMSSQLFLHRNKDPSENCKIELRVPDCVLEADDGKAGLFGGLLLVGEVEQTGAGSGGRHRRVWPTSTTNLQLFRNTASKNIVIQ